MTPIRHGRAIAAAKGAYVWVLYGLAEVLYLTAFRWLFEPRVNYRPSDALTNVACIAVYAVIGAVVGLIAVRVAHGPAATNDAGRWPGLAATAAVLAAGGGVNFLGDLTVFGTVYAALLFGTAALIVVIGLTGPPPRSRIRGQSVDWTRAAVAAGRDRHVRRRHATRARVSDVRGGDRH